MQEQPQTERRSRVSANGCRQGRTTNPRKLFPLTEAPPTPLKTKRKTKPKLHEFAQTWHGGCAGSTPDRAKSSELPNRAATTNSIERAQERYKNVDKNRDRLPNRARKREIWRGRREGGGEDDAAAGAAPQHDRRGRGSAAVCHGAAMGILLLTVTTTDGLGGEGKGRRVALFPMHREHVPCVPWSPDWIRGFQGPLFSFKCSPLFPFLLIIYIPGTQSHVPSFSQFLHFCSNWLGIPMRRKNIGVNLKSLFVLNP